MNISVIIPCYNAANYISRCLDSLAVQEYKNFDVIIVDDCSTDESVNVINDYVKQSNLNIKLLKNSVNSGPSYSRNKAILYSNSKFVCFCDSDDWYDTDFLLQMVSEQEKKNCDIVFCSLRLVYNTGRKIDLLEYHNQSDFQDKKNALINAPYSFCLIFSRRDLFLNIPHIDVRNGEDMALVPLIVGKAKTYSTVNKCLYNYYCREDSASNVPTMAMIKSLEKSFLFIHDNLPNYFQTEKEYLGTRNYIYGALVNLFKFSYNTKEANHIINNFEELYPQWASNKYLYKLSMPKRIILICAEYRFWIIIKAFSVIHSLLTK